MRAKARGDREYVWFQVEDSELHVTITDVCILFMV